MSIEEIRSLFDRARRSLSSARVLLDHGDNDFAVARAYFAMFYAASAVLLCLDVKRTKHSAVIAAFGESVVKAGLMPAHHHRALLGAFEDRRDGDYGNRFPPQELVETRMVEAAEFVEASVAFLTERGADLRGTSP